MKIKYIGPALFLLWSNELVSIMALSVMGIMFLCDLLKEAAG